MTSVLPIIEDYGPSRPGIISPRLRPPNTAAHNTPYDIAILREDGLPIIHFHFKRWAEVVAFYQSSYERWHGCTESLRVINATVLDSGRVLSSRVAVIDVVEDSPAILRGYSVLKHEGVSSLIYGPPQFGTNSQLIYQRFVIPLNRCAGIEEYSRVTLTLCRWLGLTDITDPGCVLKPKSFEPLFGQDIIEGVLEGEPVDVNRLLRSHFGEPPEGSA